MKSYQWFKFSPSDWIMGRIMRASCESQAAFIRLTCKYWNNECLMTYEDAELECGEDELNELVKLKIVKTDELKSSITIKFLDEQNMEIQEMRQKRSESGKKGGEAKAKKEQATGKQKDDTSRANGKQKDSKSLAHAKHLPEFAIAKSSREEKRREEKNKKEIDKEKVTSVPSLRDFLAYAVDDTPDVDLDSVRRKHKAWVENNWRDGNGKPIKNWKTKLLHTIGHLPKAKISTAPAKRIAL